MNMCKEYMGAFVVGGIYAAIGQLFFMAWSAVLGPASPLGMPLTLVSMGFVALITYVSGIHQRVSRWSGWGSILVFNGFACAVASAFEDGARQGGVKAGLLATFDLILWVVGTGAMLSIVICIAAFFMLA